MSEKLRLEFMALYTTNTFNLFALIKPHRRKRLMENKKPFCVCNRQLMEIIMIGCAVWIASAIGFANEAIKWESNEKSIPQLLSRKN